MLGLTPIAVITTPDPQTEDCTEEIKALQDRITNLEARRNTNATRISTLNTALSNLDNHISERSDIIITLDEKILTLQDKIVSNTLRTGELQLLQQKKQEAIEANIARISELAELVAERQARRDANQTRVRELTVNINRLASRIAALDPINQADSIARLTASRDTKIERRAALQIRISELETLIATNLSRSEALTARNVTLSEAISAYKARIAEITDRNETLKTSVANITTRRDELQARITELTESRAEKATRLSTLTTRNTTLEAQKTTLQSELAELQTRCGNGGGETANDNDTVLSYLHADHLGRPQFATDSTGATVWDGGITTPFGVSVSTMGAFTQNLMFPGQYKDVETTGADVTLSHNWHRTYDPTLGRYLQSDPIGLAGGLNRYAYVGGNPVGAVDPTGLAYVAPGGIGHGNLTSLRGSDGQINIGWIVVDLPLDPSNPSYTGNERECRCGELPLPSDDVDFFYQNGEWIKIITGNVTLTGPRSYSDSPSTYKWKGFLPTRRTFPAKKPSKAYRVKGTIDKILNSSQSPYEYLQSLKKNVPSCQNIPLD